MAETQVVELEPGVQPGTMRKPGLSRVDYVLIFGLLGLLPLLYQHGTNLSQRPHFQFFPLSWGMFAALIYLRGAMASQVSRGRSLIATISFAASLCTAVAALLLFSPWLALFALILLCLGWMYARLADNAWHEPLAWISLLVITLPLPMNLDSKLIRRLQSVSTRSASQLMDFMQIPHLRRGNILEVRSDELFVDEACSGVDSLYALIAIGFAFVVWNRQRFLPSLFTLASIPVWAWLGNLLRIFIIAWMLEWFQVDLAHGWKHTLLGLLIFSMSAAFLMCFQTLVTSLLTPFPVKTVTSNQWHVLFNKVVCWPGENPALAEKNAGRRASRRAVKEDSDTPTNTGKAGLVYAGTNVAFAFIGIASILPLMQIGPWKPPVSNLITISEETVKQTFSQADLANAFRELVFVGFNTTHRENGSINGEHSATWQFRDGFQSAQISLDFPFPAFHRLQVCYLLAGQTLSEPVDQSIRPITESDKNIEIYSTVLKDDFGEESYLCYANFLANGDPITKATVSDTNRMIYQAQVYLDGSGALSDDQRSRYEQILVLAIEKLLPLIQKLPK